jgi:pimeloyl-ACP methyl ester carboxylesterase
MENKGKDTTAQRHQVIVKAVFLCVLLPLCLCVCSLTAQAQAFPKARPDAGPKLKNIHGIVRDARGTPLPGARVFIRDMKSKTTRTVETAPNGEYHIYGLPPAIDYEIYAEFKGKSAEKRVVSSYLNREDNVLNFQVDVAVVENNAAPAASSEQAPVFKSFDLVELHASFEMPIGAPAPVPAVLLLHGFNEDRSVWKDFSKQLLNHGWAVMALDSRGHGDSKRKNNLAIQASPDWRTNPHELPQDLDPALDWLKSRPRIDGRKIVVIGADIGANLALIASGRFPEVRTVVAIDPKLSESLALAGSALDFHPRSALIVVPNAAEGDRIKAEVKAPSRVLVASHAGTSQWLADKQVADAVFQWLSETF